MVIFLTKLRMSKGVNLVESEQKLIVCCAHGRPGVTNDGVDLIPLIIGLSTQICGEHTKQGCEETSVPVPAGFSTSADASPAPALAP